MDVLPGVSVSRKTITVSAPAAGTDWSQVVGADIEKNPTGWLVKAVCAQMVQGTTQTPLPILQFLDGAGNLFAESPGATAAQAISTSCNFTWGIGPSASSTYVGATTDVHAVAPLPGGVECFLPIGYTIRTHTIGIGANSQWGNIVLFVAEC